MEILLNTIISYLVGMVVNASTDGIHNASEQKLKAALADQDALKRALESQRSLRDDVRSVCIRLAQDKDKLGLKPAEAGLWRLLSAEGFQNDLCDWLMVGALPEGDDAKQRILAQITTALPGQYLTAEKIEFLQKRFFDQLERAIFANDILARWRIQRSLDYQSDRMSSINQHAEEAAGIYSQEKKNAALDHYCEQALNAWDIIDLNNLPEGDVDMATQNLLVRQLYMPLRITVEQDKDQPDSEQALARLEAQREARRRSEAGHAAGEDGDEDDEDANKQAGIGELLQNGGNLVVLGDPGGGKTTMLRWLATAMLLRYRDDPALNQLPDVETLPPQTWIPVLIRCRDLGEADLCRDFSAFLIQHLLKSTLLPDDAKIMQALILEKIANNHVLLMVDGLDEITLPHVRVQFCQELERTAARYPALSMIVTSRIVGYRDMPYRMGRGFRHGVISELSRAHKDAFAKRWIAVTAQRQSAEERAKREQELIEALHATDRIERLTGNPMLLTTLALVKRKVGKLPNRRHKLYEEAVEVLLNWNTERHEPIDPDEALPQLEYIAYAMCQRGVQRLSDDEIMTLLEQFRVDYPSVRAVKNHSERAFLNLLEARSSILITAGNIWQKGRQEQAAWEFRHLTFQEYLAAKALIDGKYPNRDKSQSLAEAIAPLAGMVQETNRLDEKHKTPESWREALRLLVVACTDDDVDDVLAAILTPTAGEDHAITARPRAVLAGLCLAEEPNAGDAIAERILGRLMEVMQAGDGYPRRGTSLAGALSELHRSQWAAAIKRHLLENYLKAEPASREAFGGLWAAVSGDAWLRANAPQADKLHTLLVALQSPEPMAAIAAALTVMQLTFQGKLEVVDGLVDALFALLLRGAAATFAAAWALGWLHNDYEGRKPYWQADDDAVDTLGGILSSSNTDEIDTHYCILSILGASANPKAFEHILPFIAATHDRPQVAAIDALERLADPRAIPALLPLLATGGPAASLAAAKALSALGDASGQAWLVEAWHEDGDVYSGAGAGVAILRIEIDAINRCLLTRDIDGARPTIQPNEAITPERIQACSEKLNLSEAEIRQRYESMAATYKLKLAWMPDA
jgi:hypothetical protein